LALSPHPDAERLNPPRRNGEGWALKYSRSWRRFVKFLYRKSERCYRGSGMEIGGRPGRQVSSSEQVHPLEDFLNMTLDISHVDSLVQLLCL
jgi:hypothetical protein